MFLWKQMLGWCFVSSLSYNVRTWSSKSAAWHRSVILQAYQHLFSKSWVSIRFVGRNHGLDSMGFVTCDEKWRFLDVYSFPKSLFSLGIQSYSQMMTRVSNHLLSIVFRFHYHSQKVIGSLGLLGYDIFQHVVFRVSILQNDSCVSECQFGPFCNSALPSHGGFVWFNRFNYVFHAKAHP